MENNKDNNEASNSPACAACRHQRKKCKSNECVLWPHFPSDRMEEFLAVQRIFGIANVTKMMRELDNDERAAAAASLRWEANGWTEDPVHGPLRKFNRLQQELNALKASVFQYQPAMDPAAATTSYSLVPMGDNNNNNILPQVKQSLVISNGGFPDPYPANFGQRWSASLSPPYIQQPPNNPPIPGLIRGDDEYVGTMYSSPPLLPVRDMDDFVGEIFSSPSIREEENFVTNFSTSPSVNRGEDDIGTSFNSLSRFNVRGEENGGTIFLTSPIRGEDRVGTSFNSLSRWNNVRGDVRGEENGGTIFSTSPRFPIEEKDNVGTSFNRLSRWNVRGDEDNVRTQFTSSINLPVKRDGDPEEICQQHSRNSNPHDLRGSKQHRK